MKSRHESLNEWIAQQLGLESIEVRPLAGDASFRQYFRCEVDGTAYVVMDAPPPQESLEPFASVATAYQQQGIHVPNIIAAEHEQGFLLLEDLGDVQFGDVINTANAKELYTKALNQLPAIMRVTETRLGALPAYDEALLRRENALFRDWLVGTHLKLELTDSEQMLWEQFSDQLVKEALAQPVVGVHRDYHSRNLMLPNGHSSIGVIDFQDAVQGPVTYDAVSLLRDCYVKWPDELVDHLSAYSFELCLSNGLIPAETSLEQWRQWFDWMGMQRHTKASGIFCRLFHRDGKERYLADVPQTVEYIADVAGRYNELDDFRDFLQQKIMPGLKEKKS